MYTQDEFSYFGDDNSDNPDEEIDVGEGDSERQESFNQNGKKSPWKRPKKGESEKIR